MSDSPTPDSRPGDRRAGLRYHERLYVPWWWWPCAAVVVGVVGYEVKIATGHQIWSTVAYIVLAVIAVWLLWSMGRVSVSVTDDRELIAHKARLPVSVIDRAASVPASAKSAALGRQLDPAAYLMHRAWVKTMVLVVLDDPDDPTPYWLVSTRHPDRVIAALGLRDALTESGESNDSGTPSRSTGDEHDD
ncbi:DUF3093 domain-containing protein [Gordonia jinhuaensis]|uniref:Membrane protein n=1 Tax=Gordonia jinhuaensis TaxID=1517702 RepID=A0A916T2W1_9ACTN|nr:DUF3093 domain-containing protein [Gordonia jinhuaensis]GGB25704.1 membrane protein [Gordonia jinhuaensis]